MSKNEAPGVPLDSAIKKIDDFIEAARQHHARTGEWPPDPLLEEVAEMRRRVQAERDKNDGKGPDWYAELGKPRANGNGSGSKPGQDHPPA